jgi:hypothetical protein
VAYVAGSILNYGPHSTTSVPVPTGAASGHIAIVDLYSETGTVTSVPTGFTLEATVVQASNSPPWTHRRYWKRLTGADTGTYDFGGASGDVPSGWTAGPILGDGGVGAYKNNQAASSTGSVVSTRSEFWSVQMSAILLTAGGAATIPPILTMQTRRAY